MSYSDFPIPDEFPTFLPHEKVVEYLKLYAAKFELEQYIEFNTRVENIDLVNSGSTDKYKVIIRKGDQLSEETFDHIMVCTGHHSTPNIATFEGLKENFKGNVIHSHSYKNPFDSDMFMNKNVLVVGIGNSGGDIAAELAKNVAKQVILSTRRGSWIIPRELLGDPLDHVPRFAWMLPRRVIQYANEFLLTLVNGDLKKFSKYLAPRHRFFGSHPTVNSELISKINNGVVRVVPNIVRFSRDGHTCRFENDENASNIDTVVICTGYRISFPFFKDGFFEDCFDENNKVSLYKYVFHPKHGTGIAFIGLIQPFGAIIPISELQSRVAVRMFRGDYKLPSESEMKQDVEQKREAMASRYTESKRHTVQVDYPHYTDELADIIGVKPQFTKHLIKDPQLGSLLLSSPAYPCTYRIEKETSLITSESHQKKEREQAINLIKHYRKQTSKDETSTFGKILAIIKAVFFLLFLFVKVILSKFIDWEKV
ncbi:predicted protein [Naegleria gruberi]|uniref:Flavin-containing monooxygenase 1 n=1 Tax=Naegleria gruberi TaxID=5762 RepID=D2VUI8_NAEGR|nr:uncharacterized protein NAEGRDRAFT_72677 [Naegleria gruberi]EFC39456.1 predicted protein [Naegleria gruberi]|eukprot:XP_002672200.1 predicted protein [Naegleria gruberi strain NEG-M]